MESALESTLYFFPFRDKYWPQGPTFERIHASISQNMESCRVKSREPHASYWPASSSHRKRFSWKFVFWKKKATKSNPNPRRLSKQAFVAKTALVLKDCLATVINSFSSQRLMLSEKQCHCFEFKISLTLFHSKGLPWALQSLPRLYTVHLKMPLYCW